MKLLSKDLLIEYGFAENKEKINNNGTVITRNDLDIVVKYDGVLSSMLKKRLIIILEIQLL